MEEYGKPYLLVRLGIFQSVSGVLPNIVNVISAALIEANAFCKLGDNSAKNIIKLYHKVAGSRTQNKAQKLAHYPLCGNFLQKLFFLVNSRSGKRINAKA